MSSKIIRCFIFVIVFSTYLSGSGFGQDQNQNYRDELQKLKDKVTELEKTIASLKAQIESAEKHEGVTTKEQEITEQDLELEKELARELGGEPSQQNVEQTQSVPPALPQRQRQFGLFQNMNPNIGVIGNFLGHAFLDSDASGDGFTFDEAELSFRMVIDPYASADFFIAIVPPEEAVELEEAYITYLSLPLSMKAKLGFFRSKFGKLNQIHEPERPFIDSPLIFEHYFGDEGLVEPGLSLSWLIPNPWDNLIELTFEWTNGQNEISFNGGDSDDFLYLAHLRSFFDLTPNATLELGFAGMTGVNDPDGNQRTFIEGIDLTYRWKPLRYNRYHSFTFQTEFLFSQRDQAAGQQVNSFGFFTFLEYQLTQRWFLGSRFDYSEFPDASDLNQKAFSGLVTFWPSEFQTLRLQYKHTSGDLVEVDNQILAQWFFVIGAHGAHPY